MQARTLDFLESMKICRRHGIRFAAHRIVRSPGQLAMACRKVGFPLAIKVISRRVSHKTEMGGVRTGITTLPQARRAYSAMSRLRGFEGVVVQKMVKGEEIIIGGKRDVQFGPTVLVGLGGIFTEVFADYSIGICPITGKDAAQMLKSLKSYPILRGYRGKAGVNLKALRTAILKVSGLMVAEKKVEELDLNPIIGNEKGLLAVDARVVVKAL